MIALPPLHGEGRHRAAMTGWGSYEHDPAMADPSPTDRAREMRKRLNPPEARMWAALKRLRAKGYHSRRQVPFRGYFLDFACHSRRLVIEVDGCSHDLRWEHDRIRGAVLAREGYRTLRFSNADVRDNFDDVMEGIMSALTPSSPTRTPLRGVVPPHEGEGEC